MSELKRGKSSRDEDPEGEPGEEREGARRGARKGLSELRGALREGGRETRGQLRGKPGAIGDRLRSAATLVLGILAEVGRGLIGLAAVLAAALAPLLGRTGRMLGSVVEAASRLITPVRALLVVAVGCALMLALSQFADYRGIAVGVDNFSDGVNLVAPPPDVERAEAGSAHSYALAPAAVVAILILGFATFSRRWRLCRLAALIGIAAVLVTLIVDRPAGLDEGEVAQNFSGVEARLLAGYWAQLFSGVALVATSLLLGAEIRRALPERVQRRRRGTRPEAGSSAADSPEGRRRARRDRAGTGESKRADEPGAEPA